ncbi:GTPase IMAP family member 7-like [Sinocyclocheilus grahami]|uniref:GTPase IMAP family member 7-like n=1 Tax=Sinocyclocheilus grahami TaxID=75366 RepID=A0A672MZ13_SINGR|nr:PREDICTED: GTPase IMAP family member 7-like [Sinocyclocheilus grahami]
MAQTTKNVVLIGSTGNGKSSVGNMILGETAFITNASANSVTTECQRKEKIIKKIKMAVIDTPDFFDTENEEKMKSEIIKALIECSEGIHAFIIVLKVGRFTTNERKMVQHLLNTLTEEVFEHTMILFTFGTQLEEHQTIEKFVETNSQLKQLVEKCRGRCHVIDNKYKKKGHTKKVMNTIHAILKKDSCYTNALLQELKNQIEEKMKEKKAHKMSSEMKQLKAKNNVHETIVRRAAGTASRVLVNAFLGSCDLVGSGLIKTISASLENIAEIAAGANVLGAGEAAATVAASVKAASAAVVVSAALGGAVIRVLSGRKAEDTAMTSSENAIALMNDAQTALENAKNMLERATTMLKKKKK